jgi:signal transduction histidine kinase/DNA-binding response OmpR family regulator
MIWLPSISHRFGLVLQALVILICASSCSENHKQKKIVIGVSQCVESDVWRKTMLQEMKRELTFHPQVTFLYRQADGNSSKQIAQVRELVNNKIDILIISPNEAEPLTPVVEETIRHGIPVIVVDRKISTPLYSAYIGGNNYQIGKMAALYAAQLLSGKGKIIEISGLPKSSPAIDRHQGFLDGLKNYPSITIAKELNGEWLKEVAERKLASLSDKELQVDLVFAHNDRMALGTYEVYKSKGIGPVPKIIGVDGLAAKGAGLQLVSEKILSATMLYPTGGQEAIRLAFDILNGRTVDKENLIQTTVIDSSNVQIMQRQADKLSSQQQAIEQQQEMLLSYKTIYDNQQTFVYVLISSLAIALTLGGIVLYSLRENRKINKKLQQQNEEIRSQKAELEEMSIRAGAANDAKIAFFTNISHEFRTPLTLIIAPLEEILANPKVSGTQKQNLGLIYKNVFRLLRLVNQLMDFRKIEVDKMRIKATENDLISFVSEITLAYKAIAQARQIDLRLITNESTLPVWFDENMLDKVLFNLLSNAFKFTKDGGLIHVNIHKEGDKEVVITIQDNGVGMSEESVRNAFTVFHQGDYETQKGSGLGLALSKQLINLHKGSITLRSERLKGTTFEIRLPLGKEHLEEQDLAQHDSIPFSVSEDVKIYTTELHPEAVTITDLPDSKPGREYSVLIIEDNADLRRFLRNRLSAEYEILEAEDGPEGLQQAFDNIPDVIIADIVIPKKDGMAIVNIFKSDVRTSHIPVIMLSGQTNIEHQIEGMKNMADVYMTKPFNVSFLEETIRSLISNRSKLKSHFTTELPSNLKTQTLGKIDRKFISEFMSIVETNLSNEDFSVEDIGRQLGVSRIQLYRKVKALLNININDYILNARLQKAKYLLQHEETSISEIAYAVGFSSPAYFSTVFKSKFGITPKTFKEK